MFTENVRQRKEKQDIEIEVWNMKRTNLLNNILINKLIWIKKLVQDNKSDVIKMKNIKGTIFQKIVWTVVIRKNSKSL